MSDPRGAFHRLRSVADQTRWVDVDVRISSLRSLRSSVVAYRSRIREAVWSDFRKPPAEADLSEIAPVLLELKTAIRYLKSWAEPRRLANPFPLWGTTAKLYYRPKGVVLIISPWNYPFNLSLGPLVSALAAGNRVVVKPSERVPESSRLIAELVRTALPGDVATVVEGGRETAEELLACPFDHFYFTGGAHVGQIVARAALDHFSTSTLELGGKSPAIVDGTVDPDLCAEKIVRGKYMNGGQTCIAPDYVVVQEKHFERFVDTAVTRAAVIAAAMEMCSPVDSEQEGRLSALLDDAAETGAHLHPAGESNGLILVTGITLSSRLMQEEIFGHILPVLRYRSEDELMAIIERNPDPLTTYLFSKDATFIQRLSRKLKTGSMCINETLLHFGHPRMPFGGVGRSGYGHGHGKAGFVTFSNQLPTMRQNMPRGIIGWVYPPRRPIQNRLRDLLLRILGRG